jgi:hypothetical protein
MCTMDDNTQVTWVVAFPSRVSRCIGVAGLSQKQDGRRQRNEVRNVKACFAGFEVKFEEATQKNHVPERLQAYRNSLRASFAIVIDCNTLKL